MGGPSSDFNALYQQRLRDSINGQPDPLIAGDLYREVESIMQTSIHLQPDALPPFAAMALASRTPPLPQLLPKDLLPALRTVANPKEAAQREVEVFIEQATEHRRTPNTMLQTASFFATSMIVPFEMRKF